MVQALTQIKENKMRKLIDKQAELIKQLKQKLDFINGYNEYVKNGISGKLNKKDFYNLGFGFAQVQYANKAK